MIVYFYTKCSIDDTAYSVALTAGGMITGYTKKSALLSLDFLFC